MFQQTMELITGGSISSTFGDGTPVTLGYFVVTGAPRILIHKMENIRTWWILTLDQPCIRIG